MKMTSPKIESVVFKENPFGGWYAYGYDSNGKELIEKYYLSVPRWWFKVVAKRWLKKTPIVKGFKYTRD